MLMLEIIRPDYDHDELVQSLNRLERIGFFHFSCDVERHLQEHDYGLTIWRNYRTNKYRVCDERYWTIHEFDGHELDSRIVTRIKGIDSHAGYSAIQTLREADERREKANAGLTEDIAYNLAKDTRKAVNSLNY